MSAPLIFPALSNGLHFPFTSVKFPKFILFSNPTRPNFSTNSNEITAIDEPEDFSSSSTTVSSNSSSVMKAPTAPWMKGPLLVEPTQVLDFSKSRTKKVSTFTKFDDIPDDVDKSLRKIGAGRGKREMKKIFRGIEKLQNSSRSSEGEEDKVLKESEEKINFKFKFSPGQLWGEDDEEEEEENKFEFDVLDGEVEGRKKGIVGKKMPWDKDKRLGFGFGFGWVKKKEKRSLTAAELNLDKELLEGLRNEAVKMRKWVKVKKAGVTQDVVDQVNLIWKENELAMLKFDLPLSRNMDRAREIVEIKTGGLVVSRYKDALFVYRWKNEQLATSASSRIQDKRVGSNRDSSFSYGSEDAMISSQENSNQCGVADMMRETDVTKEILILNRSLYEKEADRLLDGLGPRFVDWWWKKPLPVDGDLLPETVPGFQPPVRLCPPRSRPKLRDDELTYLRNLAHSLPTHFVLGRNRKLQGLAAAILKLWEKCHIAKIAIKWGVPNTDNKQMAYELKCLTGGVLLLRNKFIIILYRGKDYLPTQVGELVTERESEITRCQLQEETVRLRASEMFFPSELPSLKFSTSGTLTEFRNIQSECLNLKAGNSVAKVQMEAEKQRLEKELRNQQRKLLILKKKIEISTKKLAELNSARKPAEPDTDQEMMTAEERECLRRIGQKMEATVVLGRRGVFHGVIESLHQHWKHREIVKVITMQRRFSQVIYTAEFLEAESKGLLVSVEKLKKGHAIILYRGKNYRRPKLVPSNLLDKREALSRSLEMQRIGSLKFFANQSEQMISSLESKLAGLMESEVNLVHSSLSTVQKSADLQ